MIASPSHVRALVKTFADSLRPRQCVPSWEWINTKGRMPDGTPFDGDRIPWAKGVCEAWDDPEVRMIVLQWGTRLGKSITSLQLMAKVAATAPFPGLFGTSTQALAERTVRNKIYPMLMANAETAHLLPPPRWQTVKEIRLTNSPWYVAYSGSPSLLADISAYYGIANEVDKWSMDEAQGGDAGEGDSLDQWLERFKEFLHATILIECSPTTKGRSRINKLLMASNNCRYWVPCPHCGRKQVLILGLKDQPGGIRFEKPAEGGADPTLARSTAYYECRHCEGAITDEQRPAMMKGGLWVPEGCSIDEQGAMVGEPVREKKIWGAQLSSLYSLQIRWGDVAEQFVRASADPRSLRMFVNGWLAEVWEPYKSKSEPEEVGLRLSVKTPRGQVPDWATWLFAGVDQQQTHLVYVVMAIGPGEREHVVDHGTCETFEELERLVVRGQFACADGSLMTPALTLIDSGFRTKETYAFCRRFVKTEHLVYPCKGANTDCGGEAYERKIIGVAEGKSARTRKALIRAGRGLIRIRVNPYYYEPIIQEQIDNRDPGVDGSLTLHQECEEDIDFLRQLCNGVESSEPSKLDPNRHLWVKRYEKEPNDYRDCKKYARCAADVHLAGRGRSIDRKQSQKATPATSSRMNHRETVTESRKPAVRQRLRERIRTRSNRRGR